MEISTYDDSTMKCRGKYFDHAVAIVGFDDARGVWIIKNSWGTDEGDGGFYLVSYDSCGIENQRHTYAIKDVKKI